MAEIHKISKLYAMDRPDGEEISESLCRIRRDS